MLTKGFEVEIYTGTPQAEIIGFSDKIVAALDGFVREPDTRNVEYTTAPSTAMSDCCVSWCVHDSVCELF